MGQNPFDEQIQLDATTTISTTTTPPVNLADNWFGLLFLFVFFSFWNTVCSVFFYPSLQRIVTGDPKGILMGMCTCLLPHLPIGFIIPYMVGGVRFELVAIWPYYISLLCALQSSRAGEPATMPAQGQSLASNLRSYATQSRQGDAPATASPPALNRIYSGEAAKFPERYRVARKHKTLPLVGIGEDAPLSETEIENAN